MRREGGRRREGKGGLSGHVAEEAFCLKSAPVPVGILSSIFVWEN